MYTKEKLLEMLKSQKASVRYEACEWIRIGFESSPEIVRALQVATYDQDQEVAERAKFALQADVHHQMAIKMGIVKPDSIVIKQNLTARDLSKNKGSEEDDRDKQVVGIFVGFIFIIIGGILLSVKLSTQRLIDNSKTWPGLQGEIIASTIKYNPPSEWASGGHQPIITYRYTVSGVDYTCKMRLAEESWKTEAARVLQTYAIGSQIKVRYDPEDPQRCVSAGDEVPMMGTWVVSLSFIGAGFLFMIINLSSLRRG